MLYVRKVRSPLPQMGAQMTRQRRESMFLIDALFEAVEVALFVSIIYAVLSLISA